MKAMGVKGLRRLTIILNNISQSETVPNDWKRGTIVRTSRKGNLSKCSNCKGMTLLPVPSKILSKTL